MRHTLLFAAITTMALLAAGCMEQEPPEAYNENLAAGSDAVLLPMAPVGADPAITTADAGALPEPASAEPAASSAGDEASAGGEDSAGDEDLAGDEDESS